MGGTNAKSSSACKRAFNLFGVAIRLFSELLANCAIRKGQFCRRMGEKFVDQF